MALTANSMANKIVTELQSLGVADSQFDTDLGRGKTAREMIVAFCQGIIDEIQTNAVVLQGIDSSGDTEQNGTIL